VTPRAKAQNTGPVTAFRPAHASQLWPVRTLAHGGAGVDESSTVENRNKVRGNNLWVKCFAPLYDELHGTVRNRRLTDEAVGAAATNGIDGVNGFHVDEGAPILAS
jgi:hypothetical protein